MLASISSNKQQIESYIRKVTGVDALKTSKTFDLGHVNFLIPLVPGSEFSDGELAEIGALVG